MKHVGRANLYHRYSFLADHRRDRWWAAHEPVTLAVEPFVLLDRVLPMLADAPNVPQCLRIMHLPDATVEFFLMRTTDVRDIRDSKRSKVVELIEAGSFK